MGEELNILELIVMLVKIYIMNSFKLFSIGCKNDLFHSLFIIFLFRSDAMQP